jgi:hypothetical protein
MAGEGRPSTTCTTEGVDARDEHGHDESEKENGMEGPSREMHEIRR